MKRYAFVFARGGSKGLAKKNIKELLGKPLLCYSIDVALSSALIDQVFVSTDDATIAKLAAESGAVVIDRPPYLATDTAIEWDAWRHAINWVGENYGSFDEFISLPATSPLRSVIDVESAIRKRNESDADICISISKANRSPYFNMVTMNTEGEVSLVISPDIKVTRRQDAPVVYDITTVVYVADPKYVLEKFGLFEGNAVAVEIPKSRAVDIDDIYDFKLAEVILSDLKNHVEK